jgi:hypothetical protein
MVEDELSRLHIDKKSMAAEGKKKRFASCLLMV